MGPSGLRVLLATVTAGLHPDTAAPAAAPAAAGTATGAAAPAPALAGAAAAAAGARALAATGPATPALAALTSGRVRKLSAKSRRRRAVLGCSSWWQQHASPSVATASAALDRMKKVERGGPPRDNLRAAAGLLQLAVEHGLHTVNARTLAAFIRCAAAFTGSLQPAGLEAWQAALKQPSRLQELRAPDAGSALLSLGTLAESDPQLARLVDKGLASQLLRQVVRYANNTSRLEVQHATNALYGAALLGLHPTQAQVQALFGTIRRSPASMGIINTTQLLLGCVKLMDVETGLDGSAAPTPSEDPYLIYYPGNELMASLLHHICQPGCKLPLRDVSQIVGACGALGFMPEPWAWGSLMAAVDAAGDLSGINASALLMGCARLGVNPGPKVIAACWDAVEREGPSDSRMVATAAWTLAVLEACDVQMWSKLAALMSSHSIVKDVQLCMWHQAHLLMEQQRAGKEIAWLTGPANAQLSRALANPQSGYKAGHFESTVKSAVERLAGGQQVALQYPVHSPGGKGQVPVDMALPELRIAIEADGVHHFLRNGSSGQQKGDTLARNRMLQGWGWHVIVVPVTAWDAMFAGAIWPSQEQLVEGLVSYLQEHTDLTVRLNGEAGAGSTSPAA